jgi:hypothetical protein
MRTSPVSGVDAVRSVHTRRARVGGTRVQPLHPHAVHRAAETGTTHIKRTVVRPQACVRACVRGRVSACVRACVPRTACARAVLHSGGGVQRLHLRVRLVRVCAGVSVCVRWVNVQMCV